MRSLLLAVLALLVASVPALADEHFEEPAVGSCHDYAFKALARGSETRASVDCAGTHREVTVAVTQLPDGVSYKQVDAVPASCYRAVFETLGGTPKLRVRSAYDAAFFFPTKAQRAQGARWIRCDLFISGGDQTLPLPDPLLPDPLPASLRRCLTAKVIRTSCARPHAFRQTGVFILHGRYPGVRRLNRIAKRRCTRLGRASANNWTFSFRNEWRAGQKRIACYERSRH